MGPQVRFSKDVRHVQPLQQLRPAPCTQPSSRTRSISRLSLVLCAAALFAGPARPALAAGSPDLALDAAALTSLEQRAAAAEPRDRCYLYSELLQGWTELASRSMTNGDESEAAKAMEHADADVAQLKSTLSNDSKRLKNAELLLEHTAHHLSDMVRVATMEQHDAMQTVLKHLNNVHDVLLAQIFAH